MKSIIPLVTFFLRHLLMVPCVIVVGCVLWTIVYLVLLVVAMIGNHGVGGPLAYPAGLLAVVVACIVIGWGILTPSCATGAVCCWIFRWPRLLAIPIVYAASLLLSYLLYLAFIESMTTHPMPPFGTVVKNHALFLSVPLGIYWWITEGPGAIFDAFRRWIRHRREKALHQVEVETDHSTFTQM